MDRMVIRIPSTWLTEYSRLLWRRMGSSFIALSKRREQLLTKCSMRGLLISIISTLALLFMTEGASGAVVVVPGADDWLFYAQEFDNLCQSKITMPEIVERLQRFADVVKNSGRKIAIAVGPNKSAIYPEKLGPAQPRFACADHIRQQLRSLLGAQHSFPFLDVYSALLQAKSSGALLWYPNDVHWQPGAAMIMAEMLIKDIDPALWNPADVRSLPPQAHVGDLGRLVGDTAPRLYPSVTLTRLGIEVRQLNDPPTGIDARAWRHYETTRGPNAARVDGRLFVLHDSLALPALPWLAQFFQESRFVARYGDVAELSPDMMAGFIAPADVVMLEIAEQALPTFADHFSDSFLETMAQTLGHSHQ